VAFIPIHSPDQEFWIIAACRGFTGCHLALTGFVYKSTLVLCCASPSQVKFDTPKSHSENATIWSLSYPIAYLIAAGLAFVSLNLSIVLYIAHSFVLFAAWNY